METVFYDPFREHSSALTGTEPDVPEGVNPMRVALDGIGPSLQVDTVKLHPGRICFMLNPLPHEVRPITAGDRMVIVAFLGMN